jgi:hypothetical protein
MPAHQGEAGLAGLAGKAGSAGILVEATGNFGLAQMAAVAGRLEFEAGHSFVVSTQVWEEHYKFEVHRQKELGGLVQSQAGVAGIGWDTDLHRTALGAVQVHGNRVGEDTAL